MLDKNQDKSFSLNLKKYREEQKQLRAVGKQLDSLVKLHVDLSVTNTTADVPTIQSDKDKTEKNKQLLKKVSGDIYIDETVKVMDNMIGQAAVAKAK